MSFINDGLPDDSSDRHLRLETVTKSHNNDTKDDNESEKVENLKLQEEVSNSTTDKVKDTEVKRNVPNILSSGPIKPLGKLPPLRGKSSLEPLTRKSSLEPLNRKSSLELLSQKPSLESLSNKSSLGRLSKHPLFRGRSHNIVTGVDTDESTETTVAMDTLIKVVEAAWVICQHYR